MSDVPPFTDEQLDDLVITVTDMRRAGHCPSGIRIWLESNGFDARKVFREGLSAREAMKIGDGNAVMVIERTLKNRGNI